jgi:hypothetical protein
MVTNSSGNGKHGAKRFRGGYFAVQAKLAASFVSPEPL